MNKKISKGEIDRLGEKIRKEGSAISEETLFKLQEYRTSHQAPLAKIFETLCRITKEIHHSSIATFRVKRFESIISKLHRLNDERFNRMWDIGGCRCILRNEEELYELYTMLTQSNEIKIIKERDYYKQLRDDGYKSFHLYIKHNCSDLVIEVQLRTLIDHDWATLVEITDFLYDTRLKEKVKEDNVELFNFHKMLSKRNQLTLSEKNVIFNVVLKYNYFEKLREVFSRNYLGVRMQWYNMESNIYHKYFLIESKKDTVPKILSFPTFTKAEESYFDLYKKSSGSNIVLTYLQSHDYNLIATAYANYILTYHSFLNECFEIFESLIVESLKKRQYLKFYKVYKVYNNLSFDYSQNIEKEIFAAFTATKESKTAKERSLIKRKQQEWLSDIRANIHQGSLKRSRLLSAIDSNLPNSQPSLVIIKSLIKMVDSKTKGRIIAY